MFPRDLEAIVFDLDGTLAATVPDIAAALNHALAAVGLPGYPEEAVVEMIGGGEEGFLRRALGPDHQELYPEVRRRYLEYYAAHLVDRTRLYPGVTETLAALAPLKLAVLSNKLSSLTEGIVARLGLRPYFRAVRGGDSYGVLKPDPRGLKALLRELEARPERTLMVGDKPADVLAGKGAGAVTVAVTYGYGTPAQLAAAGPDELISHFPRLLKLVAKSGPGTG